MSEPVLEDAAAEFPGWHCWRGIAGLVYARLLGRSPPIVVRGEDPTGPEGSDQGSRGPAGPSRPVADRPGLACAWLAGASTISAVSSDQQPRTLDGLLYQLAQRRGCTREQARELLSVMPGGQELLQGLPLEQSPLAAELAEDDPG
jgi:hypothetical protein